MKKYYVCELFVVKQPRENNTNQCLICKYDKLTNLFIEIFTKTKLKSNNELFVEPLNNYFPTLSLFDYKTKNPLILTIKELFDKYNEINYINYNLESDEKIIKDELVKHGIYENSKMYKKIL